MTFYKTPLKFCTYVQNDPEHNFFFLLIFDLKDNKGKQFICFLYGLIIYFTLNIQPNFTIVNKWENVQKNFLNLKIYIFFLILDSKDTKGEQLTVIP